MEPGEWPGVWMALQRGPGNLEDVAVGDLPVRLGVRVDLLPQHQVIRVQVDRGVHGGGDLTGGADVVVVRVGQQDGQDLPAADLADDRGGVVRRNR